MRMGSLPKRFWRKEKQQAALPVEKPKQERGSGYWEERGQGVQRLLEEPGHSSRRSPSKRSSLLPGSLIQVLVGVRVFCCCCCLFSFLSLILSSHL